jgi:hypothetical protein
MDSANNVCIKKGELKRELIFTTTSFVTDSLANIQVDFHSAIDLKVSGSW